MRIPSTVLLFRVLFQLGVILAQSVGFQGGWLAGGSVWEGMKAMEMEEVCWRTFACVCFALVVGSIGRGLEGTAQLVSRRAFRSYPICVLLRAHRSLSLPSDVHRALDSTSSDSREFSLSFEFTEPVELTFFSSFLFSASSSTSIPPLSLILDRLEGLRKQEEMQDLIEPRGPTRTS